MRKRENSTVTKEEGKKPPPLRERGEWSSLFLSRRAQRARLIVTEGTRLVFIGIRLGGWKQKKSVYKKEESAFFRAFWF